MASEEDAQISIPGDVETLQETLVTWYQEHHRSYPWRETTDAYPILVSEVMSQQTQLDRVEPAWEAFLDRWPTIEQLADADLSAVVGFWTEHRLGYNNRARYLHETAEMVCREYNGEIPRDPADLQNLPGVGPYTANAVASFAFNNGGPVIDTNVKRVLYRLVESEHPDADGEFETAAEALFPAGQARTWNNAIMELGGVVCQKTPQCDTAPCPWRQWCHAYATGDFTAPDVPTQPQFEGSRRQFRGRILSVLREHGPLTLDALGPRIRVDYVPDGDGDGSRDWLRDLVEDLAADGLVTVTDDRVQLAS